MWLYLVIFLLIGLFAWGLTRDHQRRQSRTVEEFERDLAENKGAALRASLSPFQYLKNREAEAAQAALQDAKNGHSSVREQKSAEPENLDEKIRRLVREDRLAQAKKK